jgi:hypothetical protein
MKHLVFLLFIFILPGKLFSCTCIGESTVENAYHNAKAIFEGTAIGVDTLKTIDSTFHMTYYELVYSFNIEKNYKGVRNLQTIKVKTGLGNGSCGFNFDVGKTYIVYAYKYDYINTKDNSLKTDICTRTTISNADEQNQLEKIVGRKNHCHSSCNFNDSSGKSVTVHFLYGSKPAKGFKKTEARYFGGIHGGHVFLEFDSVIFSFMLLKDDRVHIFPHKKNKLSGYVIENYSQFASDTSGFKVTSITFNLTDSEYVNLKKIKQDYLSSTPYDYAFFGMRCAAAAYDVLSHADIVKKRSEFFNVFVNFYPKLMRKRMLKYARKNKLNVIMKKGRVGRKWEKD